MKIHGNKHQLLLKVFELRAFDGMFVLEDLTTGELSYTLTSTLKRGGCPTFNLT